MAGRSARLGAVIGASALALSLGMSGCSGAGDAPVVNPSATSTQLSGDTGGLENPAGARASLTGVVCKADEKGRWSGSGRLTNDGTEAASYLVTFSVTVTKSSEVVGSKKSTITLKAGEKKEVKFKDLATTKVVADHQCVPRVVRGAS